MFPEDRVLIGVIRRQRDYRLVRDERWYRIPQRQMPHGIDAEYLGFFLSGAVFKQQSGSVAYFAAVTGVELARRRDLLPAEGEHPRADALYYRIGLGELQPRQPPITNPTRRRLAFIWTTWDRFTAATTIADLYRDSPHFVERAGPRTEQPGANSVAFDGRTDDALNLDLKLPTASIADIRRKLERSSRSTSRT
jgi:hypothetical protein